MAAEKRKAVADARPSKKPKSEDASRPRPARANDSSDRRPVQSSVLLQEEKSFPRGGASVLSPLEQKQIRAQAERDVLFEQATGKKAAAGDEDGLFDDETTKRPAKKRKREVTNEKEPGVKIHGLSYKSLVPGSIVLGRVTAITSKDLALALPNNLTGFVPITAVSPKLNERIQSLLNNDDEEEDIELKEMFHVGQWLRAIVTESGEDTKRHIELSIDPAQVNVQLEPEHVVVNSLLQASVRSVEDHGAILDLGLKGNVKGFVAKKDLGPAYQIEKLQEGQVLLCLVTGKGSDGKVLKLTPDANKFSVPAGKSGPAVSDVPDVEGLLPGTAVDMLVTASSASGVAGKIMGLVDVVADAQHAGTTIHDVASKYKLGSKTRARIVWSLPEDGKRRLGVSLLPGLLAMPPLPEHLVPSAAKESRVQAAALTQELQLSEICDAVISKAISDRGVYLDIGSHKAFAHISQLSDSRIEDVSASKYKVGLQTRARIVSFNPIDNLYYVSLKESVLAQPFLRLEDLQLGQVVEGKVDKLLLGGTGITGVLVKLSTNISALVPALHMSDVALQHPERKFREGFTVKGRILSIDLERRQARMTLKKSIDGPIWKDYDMSEGDEAKGTVVKFLEKGALIQYFGTVKGFLPIAEMSESFVEDPSKYFKLGQTVTTRALSVDAEKEQLRVSCKLDFMDDSTRKVLDAISSGDVVSGSVTTLLADKVEVELDGGITGSIRLGHLSDGSASKAENMFKKLRVGQKLNELAVLSKRGSDVILSYKSSLVGDAKAGKLITTSNVIVGDKVHGYVQNITPEGVYVEFAGAVALLPKAQLLPESIMQPAFGLRKDQSITAYVLNVDTQRQRFALTMRENAAPIDAAPAATADSKNDLTLGQTVRAKILTIKATQLKLQLATGAPGRVHVSEAFHDWAAIQNKKAPLTMFQAGKEIDVKIIGVHDAKTHKFLPISGQRHTRAVLECSINQLKTKSEPLSQADIKVGQSHIAFVNNITDECVWVNISSTIQGRVALMDLSDDAAALQNVAKSFQIGQALQVKVLRIAPENGRIDLSAKTTEDVTITTLKAGDIVPGRVTKIGDNSITVQLGDGLAAPIPQIELADDFDEAKPTRFTKNDIIRAIVLKVDEANKRVSLSARPSLVLSSGLPVKDTHLTAVSQVEPNMLVRGFVKHIGEKGIMVALSGTLDALVRVSDLSDSFLKEWKNSFKLDQLVKGRVVELGERVRLSLKASNVDENYKAPVKIEEIEIDSVVTGKVRKVEEFGVFIDIDNTQPRLSGLAHRSEIAERRVADVRGLYNPGDVVKAKVLKVNIQDRKISLGLKASYFVDASDDEAVEDDGSDIEEGGVEVDGLDVDVDLEDVQDLESEIAEDDAMSVDEPLEPASKGLSTSGFQWNEIDTTNGADYESEPEIAPKKKRKSEIKVDMTGDLDKNGPQSTSDFERQLLGQPNDSGLWIQYMAFYLELSEVQKARDIARRALQTIHIRDTEEKANIWIALLNLEVEYGDDDKVDEVFKDACQVQEPLGMHEKLASIYIDAGKYDKADSVFEKVVGNKAFRASPEVWLNYATFLMIQLKESDRARALLPRAMQSVPKSEHRLLTAKFAALEFKHGDAERGRTIFEGLMTEWSKWTAGWDMWVDIERARVKTKEDTGRVRQLYERMSQAGMKKKRAKFVFKRWLEFEEAHGDEKTQQRVKTVAQEYIEKLRGDEE